ncbi:phage holin family protein [Calidifontibacillus erzurumensis]|uniref:Phage holin family protein n=1 Tax=Calidifontibacillus erzurumensis TaxID=2741433 RepID=A0A8J8KEH7_9BACI|nr:phage holin family protein [Calidifontibacillus erzurumensis]NSL51835.1 phage holin family protein [Calidifontibacillus erzurumensis]
MRWLAHILINSLVLIVVAGYVKSFHIDGVGSAIIASLIISILNIFVKPLLVLITLPVTVLTFGLFLFVINAITLLITDEIMGSAFEIESFGAALLAAVFISILNLLIQKVIIEPLSKKD